MRADNVVPGVLRDNTVWDLFLITDLLVEVFVSKNFGNKLGTDNEDVPAGAEEEIHGAMAGEGFGQILLKNGFLVDIFEKGEQADVERNGGDVLGKVCRRDKKELPNHHWQYSQRERSNY